MTYLKEFSLTTKKYVAVSYAWGNEVTTRTMMCNYHWYAIPEHLVAAMNYLAAIKSAANRDRGQWYWIDAICISQKDPDEKALQISRMGDIYSQAEEVFLWLGQDEEDSNLALDDLRTATWSIARQHGMLKKFAHMDKPDVQHEPDPRTWRALGRIFCRAWFHRIWTVQEMLLANKVSICGTRCVFLWAFTDLARALLTTKRPIWADGDPEADRVKIWQAVESFVYPADLRERFRPEDGVPAHKLTELLNVDKPSCPFPQAKLHDFYSNKARTYQTKTPMPTRSRSPPIFTAAFSFVKRRCIRH